MGPSVESSQNRSVIRAGAPHWGQGMVSGMVRSLPPRSSPSVAPSSATSLPARMRGARVSKQCRNALNLRVMRHRVAVCGQRSTGPDLRLSRRQLPTSPLDLRIGVTAVVRWHGPSAGQRVTSDSSDTIGQHWLTLLRREAFQSDRSWVWQSPQMSLRPEPRALRLCYLESICTLVAAGRSSVGTVKLL
ncbi:MAG: hypothetical protein K0S98_1835 [Propionibacteriaceae bacterium]|nr:hypothetical protein [Propionibacteriaceae bacterium]